MMRDDLGDRMKIYEAAFNSVELDRAKLIVARLDGRHFHTLTRKCKKPFDNGLQTCMYSTMEGLYGEFNPIIAYTQSDEISLVFMAKMENSELPFNGKLFKLTSILASACSCYFNEWQMRVQENLNCIAKIENHSSEFKEEKKYLLNQPAQFDCRVFELPTQSEVVNYLLWRQQDCYRNAILSIAQNKYGHKGIQGLKKQDLLDKFEKDNFDINWEYSEASLYGNYIFKKEGKQIRFIKTNHQELIDLIFKEED